MSQLYLTCERLQLRFGDWLGYAGFLFGGTVAFYSTHRLISLWKLSPKLPSPRWRKIQRLQPWLFGLIALGSLLASVAFWFAPSSARRYLWIPAFLGLAYILPVFGRGRRLRDFGLIKPFWLTATWVALVNGPAVLHDYGTSFLIERSCLVLAIVLAFDYRDIELDKATGTLTWPQLLGKRLAGVVILALLATSAFSALNTDRPTQLAFALALTSVSGMILWSTVAVRGRADDLTYDFGIDGLLVLAVPVYWLIDGLL